MKLIRYKILKEKFENMENDKFIALGYVIDENNNKYEIAIPNDCGKLIYDTYQEAIRAIKKYLKLHGK